MTSPAKGRLRWQGGVSMANQTIPSEVASYVTAVFDVHRIRL